MQNVTVRYTNARGFESYRHDVCVYVQGLQGKSNDIAATIKILKPYVDTMELQRKK